MLIANACRTTPSALHTCAGPSCHRPNAALRSCSVAGDREATLFQSIAEKRGLLTSAPGSRDNSARLRPSSATRAPGPRRDAGEPAGFSLFQDRTPIHDHVLA